MCGGTGNVLTKLLQGQGPESLSAPDGLPDTLSVKEGQSRPWLLRGLYRVMGRHQPALLQRRLHLGSTPPRQQPRLSPAKRLSPDRAPLAVCPFVTSWRRLAHAQTMNRTRVRVFQPLDARDGQQWFYVTSCFHQANTTVPGLRDPDCLTCCRGIDHTRFSSECSESHGFVMALVSQPNTTLYDWDWISIPTGCSCAIHTVNR